MKLDVPLISQRPELPTGCEITAVTMMLQYKGYVVDKVTLAKAMPMHEEDPTIGYVGNPFTKDGWTVYPAALLELVEKVAGHARDVSGTDLEEIEYLLAENMPIVVWVSPLHGFTVHALVLTGFDEENVYYNDCWTNEKDVKISKDQFSKLWENQHKRALCC